MLSELRGFKFVTTPVLVFKKIESEDKTKYDTFYSNSKEELIIIINGSEIDDISDSIYTTIISKIQKSLGKGSGWIIDPVIIHTISISKYIPLAGSSYIRLPKELDNPRKELINIQNIDYNECFKRSLIRYLNPADHQTARITKADKGFAKKFDFKDSKFTVEIRDIHKIEKKNSIRISVFGHENKETDPIYVSKRGYEEKHVDLLLIGEEGKRHYVLITDFNTFMYDHTLKCEIKDCFKINGKERITTPKKGEYVKLKNYERKIKSPFIVYADFESILVPEDNEKQNRVCIIY